jgi:hypothetical protein
MSYKSILIKYNFILSKLTIDQYSSKIIILLNSIRANSNIEKIRELKYNKIINFIIQKNTNYSNISLYLYINVRLSKITINNYNECYEECIVNDDYLVSNSQKLNIMQIRKLKFKNVE